MKLGNLPPGVTDAMIEEQSGNLKRDRPYGPLKKNCPACGKRVVVAPAGHMLNHINPEGVRCRACFPVKP